MNLTAIAAAVAFAVGLSVGGGAAWKLRTSTINELKADYAKATLAAEREAFTKYERNSQNVIMAQRKAASRVAANHVAAGGAVAAGNGLRIASDSALRAAKDSLAACTATAAIYDTVLGAASREAERLAEAADTWEASAIEHHEAWPQ